jgi:hypothetical protein
MKPYTHKVKPLEVGLIYPDPMDPEEFHPGVRLEICSDGPLHGFIFLLPIEEDHARVFGANLFREIDITLQVRTGHGS